MGQAAKHPIYLIYLSLNRGSFRKVFIHRAYRVNKIFFGPVEINVMRMKYPKVTAGESYYGVTENKANMYNYAIARRFKKKGGEMRGYFVVMPLG